MGATKVLEVCAASGIVVRVRGDGAEGEDGHGMGTAPTQATRYRNSAAARSFLVKGSRHDFGDYYRLQIDKQFYPLLTRLYASLGLSGDRGPHETGTAAPLKANSRWYEELIAASDKEAAIFTEAQHAGSVGPARYLAKLLNLQKCAARFAFCLASLQGNMQRSQLMQRPRKDAETPCGTCCCFCCRATAGCWMLLEAAAPSPLPWHSVTPPSLASSLTSPASSRLLANSSGYGDVA
eukprot:scaffold1_cov402-Prasinococcus_capsulatus_cf.AAC.62